MTKVTTRPVVFVTDDAHVIRTSELRELYKIAGDAETLAEALGIHKRTIYRVIATLEKPNRPERAERIAAAKERLEAGSVARAHTATGDASDNDA